MWCSVPREGCRRRSFVVSTLILLLLLLPPGASRALAFTAQSLGDVADVAVMAVSGNFNAIDPAGQPNLEPRRAIAREFYRTHGDAYDFLIIFTNFPLQLPSPQARAFFAPAKNDVRGIGLDLFDNTHLYSPAGAPLERLQGTIDMADLHGHVLDPAHPEFDDTLRTLTHELLHRWGAYVHFRDETGESDSLLGLDRAHWSFLLDSGGSTLYGNRWRDNGDGTFTTLPPEQGRAGEVIGRIFNPLELYLMGLADRSQVPPLLLIDAPGIEPDALPEIGVTLPGMARTVTIDDIIAAEGERVPTAAESRKALRVAFVYAVTPGSWSADAAADRAEVAAIGQLRREWERRFAILTDGAGLMSTTLTVNEELPDNPPPAAADGQPTVAPDVERGVAWLIARQQADGSWRDRPYSAVRDTAAAVTALRLFGGSEAVAGGARWLATAVAGSHDELARQLAAGTAVAVPLLAGQNADGGWGASPGYGSTPLDTALALQALAGEGGCSAGGPMAAAVAWLHGAQQADGGWHAGVGASLVQPTVQALLALNACRDAYPLEPALADGLAWLATRQLVDGGFGDGAGTVVDTALALRVLRACGGSAAAADRALARLLARQAADGSWGSSVSQTAQALGALHAAVVAPDLAVAPEDLDLSPVTVTGVPAEVTLTATVRNLGREPAAQVSVALYAATPEAGELLGETRIDVPGGGSAPANFTLAVQEFGWRTYTVVVDGDRRVAERNEWNNRASRSMAVTRPPPTIGFASAASAGAEGQSPAGLAVRLSHPWPEPVTLNFATIAAGTALAVSDYLPLAGTLTFPPGQTEVAVGLTVVDDLLAEADETVVVELSAPSVGILGGARQLYTILDDEVPAVTIDSPPAGLIGQSAPQLRYTTTGGNVMVKVDGSVVVVAPGSTLGPFTDGGHFVEVTASNSFGKATTGRVDFSVDTVPPAVQIVSPLAGSYPGNTLPLLYQFEGGEVSQVLLDGQPTTVRSGGLLGPLADGEHRIGITAVDAAGNSAAVTQAFIIAGNGPASPGQGEVPPELVGSREIIRTSYYERGVMKVDALGNAYFATLRLGSNSGYDVMVYRFDHGGRPLWPAPVTVDFPYNTDLAGLEVDSCGNAYLFGRTKSTFTSASGAIGEDWDYDLYAAKVGSAGTLAWSHAWGSIQTDYVYAGYLTRNGSLYLTGKSEGPIDGSYADNPGREMFLTVFDAAGNRLRNENYPVQPGWAIAADEAGNIFFGNDSGLHKYSPAGQLLWVKPYPGASRIAVDSQGDVILGKNPLQKIEPLTGALLWSADPINVRPFPGKTPYPPRIDGLVIDDNDSIYVLGTTSQQLEGHQSLDGSDPYLAKFDRQGGKVWVKQLDAPTEGVFTGGFVAGGGDLYAARTRPASVSSAPDSLFTVDRFAPTLRAAATGTGANYYLQPAASCSGSSYSLGPVSVRLGDAEAECATPDQLVMNFKGSREMVTAYLANGGYPLATDIELAAYGNLLTLLAANSAGTATVTLLEVDPATGLAVRTLASKTFALTAGKATVIRDLSGLSGRISAGRSFGVRLTMSTAARSTNRISWGSAIDCPAGSRQYLRVTERPVDSEPPYSALRQPVAGTQLPEGCTLVTGSAGDGTGGGVARVDVSVDGGRSWQPATDTSADRSWSAWAYPWCPTQAGSYLLHPRATDRAGNVEPLQAGAPVTIGSVRPVQLTVAPGAISRELPRPVGLTITQLAPETATVQLRLVRDAGGDGLPAGDPGVLLYRLQDGIASSNPNLPGDEDGQPDGRIVTTLNFSYRNDLPMAPGDYLFVVDDGQTVATARFTVTAASQPQTIQGYVLDPLGVPLAGAVVQLLDKWGGNHGYAFTDKAGHYHFEVPAPGAYLLLPTAADFAFARPLLVPHTLASGQQLTVDLPMVAGSGKVAGQLLASGRGVGLPGGVLVRAESSQYVAAPLPVAGGAYDIALPAGDYRLFSDDYTLPGAAAQGYLSARTPLGQVTVNAAVANLDLQLPEATTLLCGRVVDPAQMGVAGLVVAAVVANENGLFSTAVTDADGNYCLGLVADGVWQVALNDSAAQPLGYVGTVVTGVTAAGPLDDVDLTVFPVAAEIAGTVQEGAQPVAGMAVKATCAETGAVATGRTAPDGSYRLAVPAGTWQVSLAPEPLGYEPVSPASVAVIDGSVTVRNFAVVRPRVTLNTISVTRASYDARKQVLTVEATSANADARLQVDGIGSMTYLKMAKGKYYWSLVKSLVTRPATVTVSGPEGSRTAAVQ